VTVVIFLLSSLDGSLFLFPVVILLLLFYCLGNLFFLLVWPLPMDWRRRGSGIRNLPMGIGTTFSLRVSSEVAKGLAPRVALDYGYSPYSCFWPNGDNFFIGVRLFEIINADF
jgi:hypothetical protein